MYSKKNLMLFIVLDVGRSCIIVSIGGKNVMLDCGMHMGYNDEVAKTVASSLGPTPKNLEKGL